MINKVILIGRLGKDPESLPSNNPGCRFSLATSEKYKGKEQTEWHNVVVWGNLVEPCLEFLEKGKLVYIEGKLQTNTWEKQGQKHYTTQVVANIVKFL